MCMRTNIVINDALLHEAMRYTSARTKKALVEEALRTFVEVKARELRAATYKERLQALEPKLSHIRLRQSPGEVLRADRDRL